MLENLLPLIMAGVLGFMVQPPISEVGVYAGPYWPEASEPDLMRMTAGGTAYNPLGDRFGVEFGAAYQQGGYSWNCFFCPDEEYDRGRNLHDYFEMSLLGRGRIPVDDSIALQIALGPTYGSPVGCRRKNLTQGTEQKCPVAALKPDLRLVAGAGAVFAVSRRVDVTVRYRYGFNLREWGFWHMDIDGGSDFFASSLIAGITYRRAG